MDLSYIRYNTPTAIALFLLSPLLALPYIFLGIYKQEKSAYLLFSLFIGLLAWLQVPMADLFRHTLNAYNYFEKPLSRIDNNPDFIIPLANWFLMNNGIPYQYLRLVSVSESFFVLTVVFQYMVSTSEREYTQGEAFLRFCILWLFFEFIQTTSGVRYGFALCQYVFAMHLAFNKRNYIGAFMFALLATKIHDSFSYLIPISILLYVLCVSRKVSIIILFVLSAIALAVISRFSYMLGRRADWYFEGGTSVSGSGFQNITIYGLILFILIRIFLLPYVYLAFKYFSSSAKWTRMAMVWIILCCVFLTNSDMLFRIAFVMSSIGIFLLLDVESRIKISKKMITLVLWCGIATTFLNTVNYRNYIINSRFQYIAMPVPIILQNHYEKQWIMEHVSGNKIKAVN